MRNKINVCYVAGGPYLHADTILYPFLIALSKNEGFKHGGSRNMVNKEMRKTYPEFDIEKIKTSQELDAWVKKAKGL